MRCVLLVLLLSSLCLAQTPQARVSVGELVQLDLEGEQARLIARPSARIEPRLRQGRVSLIEISGNPFTWRLSAPGRQWNADRSAPTQHLEVVAAEESVKPDARLRLSRISITPEQASLQAIALEGEALVDVTVTIMADSVQLLVERDDSVDQPFFVRARSAGQVLRQHPAEARRYLRPVLREVSGNPNLLRPGAADVYATFDDLPVDPLMQRTVRALLPLLNDPDYQTRQRASSRLDSLGPRAVQAAMQIDTSALRPEAAVRVEAFVKAHTLDGRPREQLWCDEHFLRDCLDDPDPNVRAAAGRALAHLNSNVP